MYARKDKEMASLNESEIEREEMEEEEVGQDGERDDETSEEESEWNRIMNLPRATASSDDDVGIDVSHMDEMKSRRLIFFDSDRRFR